MKKLSIPTELPKSITIFNKYDLAMMVQTQEEADEFFEVLVKHSMSFGKTREEAETIERTYLAYYAAYGSTERRERIERLFKCSHPVFRAIGAIDDPSKEALAIGLDFEEKIKEAQRKEAKDAFLLGARYGYEKGLRHGGNHE